MGLFDFKLRRAQKCHDQAQALTDEGNEREAISLYEKAIELDPKKAESFYNLGLIYKYQGKWQQSYDCNERAVALRADDEAALWNFAIAATALQRWDTARRCWAQCGMTIEPGEGPITMNFGPTPVRLNPNGSAEVVWATRIDPVRARIDSVPYAESGFRFADIVLHDGAPVGYRQSSDREYPVFNVLALSEASTYCTHTVEVVISDDNDLQVLEALFAETPHEFEDWTLNIRMLCRQCSEGKPHEEHDNELSGQWLAERTLGVAVQEGADIVPLFDEWQRKSGGRRL